MLTDGMITAGHGRALLGLRDRNQIVPLAQRCVNRNLSVRDVEAAVRAANRNLAKAEEAVTDAEPVSVDYIASLEERFRSVTGRRCKITDTKNKKTFQIDNGEVCFNVYKNLYTGEYEATEAYEYEWRVVSELIYMYGFDVDLEGGYSSFTYNEANKCYTFTYTYTDSHNDIVETQTHTVTFEFVDGKISTMKIEKTREQDDYIGTYIYDFTFTNVGTTKIDIPAYTVVGN